MNETPDIIIGLHSIECALRNSKRTHRLLLTSDKKFASKAPESLDVKMVRENEFQNEAQKIFKEYNVPYSRIPSGALLVSNSLPESGPAEIYSELESGKVLKILCLDQVTDAHNAAAILRTAAFFGVDFVVSSQKGGFGMSPGFFRIASGATESVKLGRCATLPKFLTKLQEKEVTCIGFSEHKSASDLEISGEKSICLVMGAEDKGLSHAVQRILTHCVSLSGSGEIKSLNVSVATALAMNKFFGPSI